MTNVYKYMVVEPNMEIRVHPEMDIREMDLRVYILQDDDDVMIDVIIDAHHDVIVDCD